MVNKAPHRRFQVWVIYLFACLLVPCEEIVCVDSHLQYVHYHASGLSFYNMKRVFN
uniref:Uncharacterized protein n=1 Tax=Arundo donax TaxID=35708 RepID=A0A0A9BDL5_ARUDO